MEKSQMSDHSTFGIKSGNFRRRLKALVYQSGGDLFGVADLEPARGFIIAQGGETLIKYPRAISIGIRLSDEIIDQHGPDESHENSLYWHHVYRVVTPALDSLALRIQRELQADGYMALPIPTSLPYNRETLKSVFSHKLAAHLSGLGWIGKNCLLITPDFGPRVRFVTILTDAPLPSGIPLNEKCGKCQSCVVACPVQAFKGVEFKSADDVAARFDTWACEGYRRTHPCGICVARCPAGRPEDSGFPTANTHEP
jgi:epoxyqueuosine reductase QueG